VSVRLRGATIATATVLLVFPGWASAAQVSGDYDGDGRADLAIGVEGQTVGGRQSAGSVHVLYGSRHGVGGARDQVFTQDTPGVKDVAENADELGPVLANGDFNGDGRSDLAIGVPEEDFRGHTTAGIVQVLYGSREGLRARGNQRLVEGTSGVPGDAAKSGQFGGSLAAGDFGRGPRDDLAIGAYTQTVGPSGRQGAAVVLYGARRGLSSSHARLWTQDSLGVKDVAEDGDAFGFSLAAANFGHDRHDDLAIGVVGESVGTVNSAGAVNVLYGSRAGLRAKGGQFWSQDSPGIADAGGFNEEFAWSLAAGDVGRGDMADLAVGVINETVGTAGAAGAVNVVYGSRTGLQARGNQFWTQKSPGISGTAQSLDNLGSSLAIGNVGHGGPADLVAGANRDSEAAPYAGAVNVVYGSARGLRATGNQIWTQDSEGVSDHAESGDTFGWAVATGRFRGGRTDDLAIAVPIEAVGMTNQAGAVNVLRGSRGGVTARGDEFLTEGRGGLLGSAEAEDLFGAGLSALKSNLLLN
jgi:FG-GAP repeat